MKELVVMTCVVIVLAMTLALLYTFTQGMYADWVNPVMRLVGG